MLLDRRGVYFYRDLIKSETIPVHLNSTYKTARNAGFSFLGDSAFDSIDIYAALLGEDGLGFKRTGNRTDKVQFRRQGQGAKKMACHVALRTLREL
jgi:hypothetical protein